MDTYLHSITSLYHYYGIKQNHFSLRLIEGSIVDVARLFDEVFYPGIDGVDAVCVEDGAEVLYSCTDGLAEVASQPFTVMNLFCRAGTRQFLDPAGCYPDLRERCLRLTAPGAASTLGWFELLRAAALVSAFGFKIDEELRSAFAELPENEGAEPAPLYQRIFLTAILTGEYPAAGLEVLRDYGFIERFWPEIWATVGLSHSKEYHPEGDVWEHTLETLYHRKSADLDISLALLLHDAGKPDSRSEDGNRFNRHAQIGRRAAASFLRRLEFNNDKIEKICFLVENHMLPAAISRLPAFRAQKELSSPWFPELLEVFRCDLLSTFRGPEAYYEACKAYRAYLKNTKNPFRTADGRKRLKLYVD